MSEIDKTLIFLNCMFSSSFKSFLANRLCIFCDVSNTDVYSKIPSSFESVSKLGHESGPKNSYTPWGGDFSPMAALCWAANSVVVWSTFRCVMGSHESTLLQVLKQTQVYLKSTDYPNVFAEFHFWAIQCVHFHKDIIVCMRCAMHLNVWGFFLNLTPQHYLTSSSFHDCLFLMD